MKNVWSLVIIVQIKFVSKLSFINPKFYPQKLLGFSWDKLYDEYSDYRSVCCKANERCIMDKLQKTLKYEFSCVCMFVLHKGEPLISDGFRMIVTILSS